MAAGPSSNPVDKIATNRCCSTSAPPNAPQQNVKCVSNACHLAPAACDKSMAATSAPPRSNPNRASMGAPAQDWHDERVLEAPFSRRLPTLNRMLQQRSESVQRSRMLTFVLASAYSTASYPAGVGMRTDRFKPRNCPPRDKVWTQITVCL